MQVILSSVIKTGKGVVNVAQLTWCHEGNYAMDNPIFCLQSVGHIYAQYWLLTETTARTYKEKEGLTDSSYHFAWFLTQKSHMFM